MISGLNKNLRMRNMNMNHEALNFFKELKKYH